MCYTGLSCQRPGARKDFMIITVKVTKDLILPHAQYITTFLPCLCGHSPLLETTKTSLQPQVSWAQAAPAGRVKHLLLQGSFINDISYSVLPFSGRAGYLSTLRDHLLNSMASYWPRRANHRTSPELEPETLYLMLHYYATINGVTEWVRGCLLNSNLQTHPYSTDNLLL
jgi:hypothetical protein